MIKQTISKYLAIGLLLFLACSSDDGPSEPSPQELTREQLTGSWSANQARAIVLDGTDVSLNYPQFSISFGSSIYSTVNAGDLLSASGTWAFIGDATRLIQLDGTITVNINTLSSTELAMTFEIPEAGGRVNDTAGSSGNYEIRLGR